MRCPGKRIRKLLQQNVKLTIYAFSDSNSTKSENKTLQIKYFTEDKMSELLRIKINKGNNYTNKLAWAFYIKMYQSFPYYRAFL